MVSIRQTTYPDSLPDFRNLGVIARVLVAVNAIALGGALFAAPDLAQAIDRFPQIAALVEPLLLACLVVLFVLSPLLARRSEEHTSELQSQSNIVCRLLLEK